MEERVGGRGRGGGTGGRQGAVESRVEPFALGNDTAANPRASHVTLRP